MKKYLHFLMIFIFVMSCKFAFAYNKNNVVVGDPELQTPLNIVSKGTYYRWRSDVSPLTTSTTGWLDTYVMDASSTTSTIPTLDFKVNANTLYRLRVGCNFQVGTLKARANFSYPGYVSTTSTGWQDVTITSWSIEKNVHYTLYYYAGDGRTFDTSNANWKLIPTAADGVAPFYLKVSGNVSNGTTIGNSEFSGNMLVLPAKTSDYGGSTVSANGTSTGQAYRPNNPYFYMGGAYYAVKNSDDVAAMGYSYGTQNSIIGGGYPNGSGTSGSYTSITSNQKVFSLGAEMETSLYFTNQVKANQVYTFMMKLNVPFSGTGTLDGSFSYSIYTINFSDFTKTLPKTNTTQTIVGAFKTPATVLPVSLKSFIATKQGTSALLNWVTASEINNKGFYVQRSTDGKSFSNLGFVSSLASGGNSNTTLNYSYTDATPGTGAVYYRLNQVDLDGKSKYSDIQSLFMGSSSADVMVAPNPVITNVNLNNAQVGADYAIYSMSGQLVKSGKVSASVMSIDASNLPSGMYVIKTSTNAGAPVFKKFIKK